MKFTVTSEGLNLRSAPRMGKNIIDQLSKGDVVILHPSDVAAKGWLRVKVERTGQVGWVSREFLAEVRRAESALAQQGGSAIVSGAGAAILVIVGACAIVFALLWLGLR